MKKAIIIKGPSGIGKSTISELICKNHNYKHSDTDEFKILFSSKRSKDRTEIGEYVSYVYNKELIQRSYDIVIEALPEEYIQKLIPILKRKKYKIIRILLRAPLKQCIENNSKRLRKGYDKKVVEEIYDKLSNAKGDVIDVTGKSVRQIYNMINNKYEL